MVFTIVIHPEPSGGYWAEMPSRPGCYSQGETMEELQGNLREAITGYLEVLQVDDRTPAPEVQVPELAV